MSTIAMIAIVLGACTAACSGPPTGAQHEDNLTNSPESSEGNCGDNDIGAVAGDVPGNALSVRGQGSKWFSFELTETSYDQAWLFVRMALVTPDPELRLDVSVWDSCDAQFPLGVQTLQTHSCNPCGSDAAFDVQLSFADDFAHDDSRRLYARAKAPSEASWEMIVEGGF